MARFKRRNLHVLNLISLLGGGKVRLLNQLQSTLLFLGWSCRSIRSNRTVKPRLNDRNMSAQHIAALLAATYCLRLATLLRHIGCYWFKFEDGQISPNNTQHVAARRNRVAKREQHVALNNVVICCFDMLRWFGRGLKVRLSDFWQI